MLRGVTLDYSRPAHFIEPAF